LEDGGDPQEIAYSEAKALVTDSPQTIRKVVFHPRPKKLEIELTTGRTLESRYPSDESAVQFEQLLDANGVAYESRGSGDSAWWSILTWLLPFVLFFAFWIFLMSRVKGSRWDCRSADADNEQQSRG
jgi:ATP-dependent Zn protease